MTKIEEGTYTRYRTPMGLILEIFKPNGAGYYYRPSDGSEPAGPFSSEKEALKAAY